MRDFDYLPYEKAVEEMAREYAKVRPAEISSETTGKNAEKNSDIIGCIYLNCLEQLMLLRQLRNSIKRRDVQLMCDELYELKTTITQKNVALLATQKARSESPAVSSLPLPALLRRLLQLEYHIIASLSNAFSSDIRELEGRAANMINELILYIYVFN